MAQPLDDGDRVALQPQRRQPRVRLQPLDARKAPEVEVQLVVQLGRDVAIPSGGDGGCGERMDGAFYVTTTCTLKVTVDDTLPPFTDCEHMASIQFKLCPATRT